MNRKPNKERDLYPDVIRWFSTLLKEKNRHSRVSVFDTSQVSLWKFLKNNGYSMYFKEYLSYEIQVDITGVVLGKKTARLAFIECKLKRITLKDISQLLGYSRVARPYYSIITSPSGISSSVNYLLKCYNRYDILKYDDKRRIRIATWDLVRKEIDLRSILPPGEHF